MNQSSEYQVVSKNRRGSRVGARATLLAMGLVCAFAGGCDEGEPISEPPISGSPHALDVALSTGVMSLTANLDVMPVYLRLAVDFAIDRDTGAMILVATSARLEDTETFSFDYDQPDGIEPVLDNDGWAVFLVGSIAAGANGEYVFQTEPTDLLIPLVGGAMPLSLVQARLEGTIVPAATVGGRDTAVGTLSVQSATYDVGDDPIDYENLNVSWSGGSFAAAEIPVGLPKVCGAPACGALASLQGKCKLPANWNPSSVCGQTALPAE